MGVVYRATDNTLDRTVALKFLAPNLILDPDSRARLIREAKAAAALSHPNICRIFEIGESDERIFLVLEFVDGERLDKKIELGPLALEEVVSIGLQIARALDIAHKKGVVHRDIKPPNIIVNADGHATLMDFGLAQLLDRSRLTRRDMTLGTAPYMSPEQAKGSGTDHRTDIWSLGVVLYEMTTGRLPFRGDFEQAVIYSVQNEPPDPVTALRSGLPMHLEWIIEKALSKNREDRYRHAEEIMVDLRSLQKRILSGQIRIASPGGGTGAWEASSRASGEIYSARTESRRPVSAGTELPDDAPRYSRATRQRPVEARLNRALLLSLTMLAATLGTIAWLRFQGEGPPRELPLRKFTISTAVDTDGAAISPDGRHIAFLSGLTTIATRGLPSGSDTRLWLADLETNTNRLLEGTDGASYPFWSPDGEFIGFRAGRDLKKISAFRGPPIVVCQLPTQASGSGTWSPDGETIVFESFNPPGLYSVSSRSGDPKLIWEPDGPDDAIVTSPHFLPSHNGRSGAILFDVGSLTEREIVVLDLDSGEHRVLMAGAYPVYSPTGHIVFQSAPRTPGLWAVRFSMDTLMAIGERFSIDSAGQGPSVSRDGTLAHVSAINSPQQLVWCDRRGNKIEMIGQPQARIIDPALSPDGQWIAVRAWENKSSASDIWLHDIAAGTKRRLTFEPTDETGPIWGPSAWEVTYLSRKEGNLDILSRRIDGANDSRAIVATPLNEYADDWSSDGKYLIYTAAADETHADLWYLKRAENVAGYESVPLLRTPARELVAKFSRDGRYIAYCSNESGRYEVFVQSFPSGKQRWQVSFSGGTQPRWSRDGKELFYVNDDELIAVPVDTDGGFRLGRPQSLYRSKNLQNGFPIPTYDVSHDGQRFVMVESLDGVEGQRGAIEISQNWFAEFRGRDARRERR